MNGWRRTDGAAVPARPYAGALRERRPYRGPSASDGW